MPRPGARCSIRDAMCDMTTSRDTLRVLIRTITRGPSTTVPIPTARPHPSCSATGRFGDASRHFHRRYYYYGYYPYYHYPRRCRVTWTYYGPRRICRWHRWHYPYRYW